MRVQRLGLSLLCRLAQAFRTLLLGYLGGRMYLVFPFPFFPPSNAVSSIGTDSISVDSNLIRTWLQPARMPESHGLADMFRRDSREIS